MPAVLVIAFGWVLTVSVCWTLGLLLLRALSLRLFRQEEFVFAFVVGAACFSTLMFLLAAAGFVYRGVLLALAVLILGFGCWKRVYRFSAEPFPPLPRFMCTWIGICTFWQGAPQWSPPVMRSAYQPSK